MEGGAGLSIRLGPIDAFAETRLQNVYTKQKGLIDTRSVRVSRHGLAGMRYRVEALDGQLTIHTAPGQGTRIVATLPRAAAVVEPAAA